MRLQLVIRQIPAEKRSAAVPRFLHRWHSTLQNGPDPGRIAEGYLKTASEEELAVFNREPYEDVIGERYAETSYETRRLPCGHLVKRMEGACCLYRELGNAVVVYRSMRTPAGADCSDGAVSRVVCDVR